MKKPKFQRPTGMHDILPQDQKYFQNIYNTCKRVADFYGFRKIDTPILEETELFIKGTGTTTDIVQKQMYNFKIRGGDCLTLRPEFTPGIIRAYIEHGMQNLVQPVKLYSFGPVFRLEKPQAGRYRQFSQFNLENIGERSPVADAQVIQIFYNILLELEFKKLIVKINSIGDNQCRPYYKRLLINYCKTRQSALCSDCQRRLKENPLRVLDCKREKCQEVVKQAPQIIDHLCEECHSHFKSVLEFLDEIELPYHLDPYLVRGLDYYTKTVFEVFEEKTDGNALIAGGRYDNLVKLLGGGDISAVGAAMGVERIILSMKAMDVKFLESSNPQVFLVQLGDLAKRKGLKFLENFRKANIQISESFGRDSLKSQLKIADKLEVKYALILGQKEALDGTIIIKDMKSSRQETVKMEKVVSIMKKKLKGVL
ncbi:histidine--tRNA ligase [Dehalococcoidia bacterium]|nr:histidine--tRNA ligase [Dehalococcoidia bacterium]